MDRPRPARLVALLGPVDIPYRERRLLFLLAGVNELYTEVGRGDGAPLRSDLDQLKTQAWNMLEELRRLPQDAAELRPQDVPGNLGDGLIFPTVALSQLPQFTPIGVAQFSPMTACAIPIPQEGKLKGLALHHFTGFAEAEWRENDYLWGRLDGVELLLRQLYDAASTSPRRLTPCHQRHEPMRSLAPAASFCKTGCVRC